MTSDKLFVINSKKLPPNTKIFSFVLSLQKNFEEIVLQFEQLYIESENFRSLYNTQIQKCESDNCTSSQGLMKAISLKNNILDTLTSTLKKLDETKNFNFLNEAFKILQADNKTSVEESQVYSCDNDIEILKQNCLNSSEKDISTPDNVSLKDDSLSEIEGTPTGRISPIIKVKKLRNSPINNSTNGVRDKKKCPSTWSVSEKKSLKLSFATNTKGNKIGKMRQSRLNIVKMKPTNIVDLLSPSSPVSSRVESLGHGCSPDPSNINIKKEFDNNISPVLETKDLTLLHKSKKISPTELNVCPSNIKIKMEHESTAMVDMKTPNEVNIKREPNITEMHNSRNISKSISSLKLIKKKSPGKGSDLIDNDMDMTLCETNASIGSMKDDNIVENIHEHNEKKIKRSPEKRPLAENINISNCEDINIDASMSLLPQPSKAESSSTIENHKISEHVTKELPKKVETLYKQPTVRKKNEKKALLGWTCCECEKFYGELYKDDPDMMKKKINECSKHRGKWNPIRPKTPPGFWEQRWEVPEDTEEFNRRNDAI